jgi:arginine utilization regulatory protein
VGDKWRSVPFVAVNMEQALARAGQKRTPSDPLGLVEHKPSLGEAVERLERAMIEEALRDSKGNLARASRALGTTERILRYKVAKYGLGSLRPPGGR